MSALIDPGQFPVIAGDMAQLRTDARTIDDAGAGIAEVGALVHARWQRLEPVYRAPEAAALMAATEPVRTVTEAVGANFSDAGIILTVYADTVEQLQQELASLRAQADALRADAAAARPDGWEIVGDIAGNLALPVIGPIAAVEGVRSTLTEPWRDDPALVARNSALVTAVAELVAAYEEAQRRCASDLNALHGAAPVVADDGDGVPEPGEYGFTLEQYRTAAAEGGLPWGSQVAEPQPWFVDVVSAPWRFAQGAGDAVAGTSVGLAALVGYSPDSGFEHAGATAGTAWTNLGKLVLAAGTYLTPGGMLRDQAGVVPFLEPGEGGRILTDTGKALVAWDQWDDDPARAGGLAVTNLALAVVGTRGLGAGARSLGAAIQAGRTTGFAAHVGAGLTRVGEVIGRLPTVDKLVNGVSWRLNAPSTARAGVANPGAAIRLGDTTPDSSPGQPTPASPASLTDDLARPEPEARGSRSDAEPGARADEPDGPAQPADAERIPDDTTPSDLGNQPDGSWIGEEFGTRLELDPHANTIADDLLQRAADAERTITPQINQIVDGIDGCRLRGYEYVLKSEDSLKRKLASEIGDRRGASPEVAIAKVQDAVRYTIEIPAHRYRAGTAQAADMLRARGFENIDFKVKWHVVGKYKGVNTNWRDPVTGQVFELQFHTPASLEAKTVTHPIYDQQRLPGISKDQRDLLAAQQAEVFDQVDPPPRVRSLHGVRQSLHPQHVPGVGHLDIIDSAGRLGTVSGLDDESIEDAQQGVPR